MWHSSAAALQGWPTDMTTLRTFALRALDGVGDRNLGEWDEWTGYAFHIRRRLSVQEQGNVGPVLDVRGTNEAERRLARVLPYLMRNPMAMQVLAMEAAGIT